MRTMCFLFHQVQLLGHLLSIFAVEEFLSNKKNMAILVATLQEMMMLLPTLQIWDYVFFLCYFFWDYSCLYHVRY